MKISASILPYLGVFQGMCLSAWIAGSAAASDLIQTGVLDKESNINLGHLAKHRKHQRSSGFQVSLNLPSLAGTEEEPSSVSFNCDEKASRGDASTYTCTSDTQRRLSKADGRTMTESSAKAYFAINGPFIFGGVKVEESHGIPPIKYQITTVMQRDENNEMTNVSYKYAAASVHNLVHPYSNETEEEKEDPSLVTPTSRVAVVDPEVPDYEENRQARLLLKKETSSRQTQVANPLPKKDIPSHKRRMGDDDGSNVDILMYFTQRSACQWLEESYPCTIDDDSMIALQTAADALMIYSNEVLADSEIEATLTAVSVAVDPTYDEGTDLDPSDTLKLFANNDDGYLDDVHKIRDDYSADLVSGVFYREVDFSWGNDWGRGYKITTFPDRALGFTISGGDYPILFQTTLHEIGHQFGCNHHRDQYDDPDDEGEKNFGWSRCDLCWVTIMTYDVCEECGDDLVYIDYFSNPNVKYGGVKTGNSKNNNAEQMNKGKLGISMFRFKNKRIIEFVDTYFSAAYDYQFFDVIAKDEDITISNLELYVDSPDTCLVEVYFARSTYSGDEFSDDFWVSVASETLTPMNLIDDSFYEIAMFESFDEITVAAGDTVAIKLEMIGCDRVLVAYGEDELSEGDIFMDDDYISLTAGSKGYENSGDPYLSNSLGGLYGALIYSAADTSTPAPTPANDCGEDDSSEKFWTGNTKINKKGKERPIKKKCKWFKSQSAYKTMQKCEMTDGYELNSGKMVEPARNVCSETCCPYL